MSDGYAIVGHCHALVFCLLDAVEDVFAVEHAGAALDDQVIWGQVFGVVGAAYDGYFQGFAVFFLQHPRDLFSADVFFQWCMGAAFGDQDAGVSGQIQLYFSSLFVVIQVAFVVGKEDGKGGQQAFCRFVFVDIIEDLGVSDDQFWGIFQLVHGFHKFVGGGT